MKIPVYDQAAVSSAPLAAPVDTVDRSGLGRSVAAAADVIGSNVSRLQEEDKRAAEKMKQQDQAASVLAAENALHKEVDVAMNDHEKGLLTMQGEKAVAASAGVYQGLSQKRDQIAQSFGLGPEEQRTFRLRSDGMLEDTYRQGEQYVAHQRRASNQADVDAAQTLTLNSIAQFSNDNELVARSTARVESGIRSQAISPQAGEAAVAEWRGKVAQTVLNSRISGRDVEGAKAYFDQPDVRASLGPAAQHYEKTIQLLGDQVGGVNAATSVVNGARRPVTGFVDEAKVQEALNQVPPGPRRQVMEEEIRKQVGLAREGEKDTVNQKFNGAITSFLTGGRSLSSIPAQDKAWLQQYAPQEWLKLEAIQNRDIERARSRTRPGADTAEEQEARLDALNDLTDNRDDWASKSPEEFMSTWGSKLGPKGLHEVSGYFAHLRAGKDKSDKPMPAPEAKTVLDLATGPLKLPKKASQRTEDQNAALARVIDEVKEKRAEYVHANKKEPTQEQLTGWTTELLTPVKVKGSGILFDDTVPRVVYETNPKYRGKTAVPKNGAPTEGVPATPQSAPSPAPVRMKGKDGNTYELNPATKGWRKVG